jgi:glutaredoxin
MRASIVALVLGAALASPVAAGPVEDAFRGFIDQLRGQGRTIAEALVGQRWQQVRTPVLEPRVDELPLGRGLIAVFVAPGCLDCREALEHLQRRGRKIEVLDLSTSRTAREAYALAEGHGLPLVLIGSQRLTGWNKRLYEEAVRRSITDEAAGQQGQGA